MYEGDLDSLNLNSFYFSAFKPILIQFEVLTYTEKRHCKEAWSWNHECITIGLNSGKFRDFKFRESKFVWMRYQRCRLHSKNLNSHGGDM